jgi:hypothetical protein
MALKQEEEMGIINWLLLRGREPSTWAGLSGLALALGLSAAEWNAVGAAVAAIFGAAAVFVKESGGA